jgi:hypothetical protein
MKTQKQRLVQVRWPGTRTIRAATVLSILAATTLAQPTQTKSPRVYLRHIRLDPLLVASGFDSARLHGAVEEVLRKARLLSETRGTDIPAMDIDLGVPRPATGGAPEPRALLRVEVGRNHMETGRANRLVWDTTVSVPEYPTWRRLIEGASQAVVDALHSFMDRARPGT